MRFCPVCTQSFSRDFNRCPRCAVMLVEETGNLQDSSVPDGLEVAWSLSHVADEVNRLCGLLEEHGIAASVSERDTVFPWPRWREMSASLSFPNDVRNVRLLVDAEEVEEAQRVIEEASTEFPLDEELAAAAGEELDEADRSYYDPGREIGDTGGPPLAER
jgi:hypothetical protein